MASSGYTRGASPMNGGGGKLVLGALLSLLSLLVLTEPIEFSLAHRDAKSEEERKKEKVRQEAEEEKRLALIRAKLPNRKKKEYIDWNRLSPETTVLLSATPADVDALSDHLPFQIANVTMQEHTIAPVSAVDREMQQMLQANYTHGMKTIRTSVVFADDMPIKLDNSRPRRGAVCQEAQRAMLLSFNRVQRKPDGQAYASFNLHSPSAVSFHKELAGEYNLKALNPFMWTSHFPTEEEFTTFRGTAICMKKGSRLQLLRGWPVAVPEYKEGPWQARVMVFRAFVSPSADSKKKNLFVLQATLKVTRTPKDGIFKQQNMDVIPFMGYIKINNKKYGHLEAAIIRHKLLNKGCTLRRVDKHSQVELKCDDVDAKLTDLNEMLDERPLLRNTFKKAGIFSGVSAASYSMALVSHLLSSVHSSLEILPPQGFLLTGTGFALAALLSVVIAGPVVGLKRFKWRKMFAAKKREYLQKIVDEENSFSSAAAPVVDLVFVVNELKHAEEGTDASGEQAGTTPGNRDDSPTQPSRPTDLSPMAQKIQNVIDQYHYLETVAAAYDDFTRIERYRVAQEEVQEEAKTLRSFLKRTASRTPGFIGVTEEGELKLTVRQLTDVYAHLGKQIKAETERAIEKGPFTPIDVLISRHKVERLHEKSSQLLSQIRSKGGDVAPMDTPDHVESLKARLSLVTASKAELTEALESVTPGSQEEEDLRFAQSQIRPAKNAIKNDLRVFMDDDLGMALEEVDNLKEKLAEIQKNAGSQPSPLQEVEIQDVKEQIIGLNEKITKRVLEMRQFGFHVDILRVVELESE
ncbi:Chaperone protein dnaJ, related [Neospora caninum Liverpool]|uniref:Chaperone protein dnaJ, related n=1 Tax=Neospora caninum (strain Liverpool) TaxID=572307 RepID=F0VCP0_NEOCL|nr:Chaperone protein dnaJ, related [Neospora caninum Liverpool]CBZ51729.1 Chaperone protein dnaJ, related [Neospora caninum Liverpool]CEL65685.1 TPA: Chaperone protein dnaJ, related [Neospora caninum Liverpool]|eukprot:XP_003881762.1 Chaperone protein dnaJ, related [Neospora caninum Liverpool]